MKQILKILKPLSFLPAILMMMVITAFSSHTGEKSGALSFRVSYDAVEVRDLVLQTGKDEATLKAEAHRIHPYVRKLAHVCEYLLLSICVAFPLYVYGLRGLWLPLVSVMFCVSFAGVDEYHQTFVRGRGGTPLDVAIDSIGILTGSLLVQIFCWCVLHSPEEKKKS